MLFGYKPKPRVTKEEWQKVRSYLYENKNFTQRELEEVEEIFRADLIEEKDIDNGIDASEITKGIQYMRTHKDVHHISDEKIIALEEQLIKYVGLSS